MKQYLLLRENEEAGPYSVAELKNIGLNSYDLIWVEGKSTQWMYPSEIEELADLPIGRTARKGTIRSTFDTPQVESEPCFAQADISSQPPGYAYADLQTFPDEKESYFKHLEERKFSFQNGLSRGGGLWIVGLLIALISSAFVVKSIVESFDENPYKEPEANVYTLPVADDVTVSAEADPSYKNALITEVIAVDTTASKPVKKKPAVKDLKKQISLQANEYKQGVLGGINDLQITLKNSSQQKIDRVTVEVKFMKPNGGVLKTEHFDLTGIPAGGRKVLAVPNSKRGVNVTYKVVAAESGQQKASIRNA